MKIFILLYALLLVSCETVEVQPCTLGGDLRSIVKNRVVYHNQIVSDYKLCVRNFPSTSSKDCKEFAERINIAYIDNYDKKLVSRVEADLKKCGEIK